MTLDAVTLPQILKSAGYSTGIFGKWHLGDEEEYLPNRRGFDEMFIHGGGGIGQSYPGSCGDAPGNSYFDPVLLHNDKFVKTQGYCTDLFYAQATQWIDAQRHSGQPFFAYIATNAPHAPYTARPADAHLYEAKVDKPQLAHFYGMIHNIDENIGKLLSQLAMWGIDQQTLVIFMNDNGTAAGQTVFNAGMRGAKGTAWLGGTRSSAFWRWPGTLPAAECGQLSAHIDILPTLAEISGAKLPPAAQQQIEGRSLLPLLQDPAADAADRHLFTHVGRWPKLADPNSQKYKQAAVRNRRWSLVSPDGGEKPKWQLYDLQSDYGQKQDVIEQHPQVASQLQAQFEAWWSDCLPKLVNEKVLGPDLNPYAVRFWNQFGGQPSDADRKRMNPRGGK
jgi:arylsulfatase